MSLNKPQACLDLEMFTLTFLNPVGDTGSNLAELH